MDSDQLGGKAKELWETIVRLETEKYDLEERQKRQDYDVSIPYKNGLNLSNLVWNKKNGLNFKNLFKLLSSFLNLLHINLSRIEKKNGLIMFKLV